MTWNLRWQDDRKTLIESFQFAAGPANLEAKYGDIVDDFRCYLMGGGWHFTLFWVFDHKRNNWKQQRKRSVSKMQVHKDC